MITIAMTVPVMLFACPPAAAQRILAVNPYNGIDWSHISHHKGNLHTHTTESDGSIEPAQVVDLYHEHGYTVLSITDHNKNLWPWDAFGRAPETLGMLAISGNELSRHHHTLSLFCEYETGSEDLDEALAGVAAADGIAVLCHPAMHWEKEHSSASRLRKILDASARPQEVPEEFVAEYIELFKRHPHLVATEVLNASEPLYRYPLDRELWDRLLMALMPERPVWGVNTDDMHTLDHFGTDYIVFLTKTLDTQAIRNALKNGAYYFACRRVPESGRSHEDGPPRITAISHDETARTIEVKAKSGSTLLPDEAYVWIANGKPIATGPRLNYNAVEGLGTYARLEITALGGTTFTNPFGFR